MSAELLVGLLEHGFQFWTQDGQLKFRAPKGALTPEVREALARHKTPLLALVGTGRKLAYTSTSQRRLLFLDSLTADARLYNMSGGAFRVRGALDVGLLERCLAELYQRHESLRTVFEDVAGRWVQVVLESPALDFRVVDLTHLAVDDREGEALRQAGDAIREIFDLRRGPLFRAVVYRIDAGQHLLVMPIHHTVFDGWSMGVLIKELSDLYRAYERGTPSPLPPIMFQYADYARWEKLRLTPEYIAREQVYWREKLSGQLPGLELPTDHPRPVVQSYAGATQTIELSRELTARVHALSRKEGATAFMTLLAAYNTFLFRYTRQDEVLVGTSTAGRTHPQVESLTGFFLNTLILRNRLAGDMPFTDLLRQVRETALEAYAHQGLPVDNVVEAVQPDRDPSRNPIVQTTFIYENMPFPVVELAGRRLEPLALDTKTAPFDIGFTVFEFDGAFRVAVEYKTDLFEPETIARMLAHYGRLIEGIVADPSQCLADLPMLTEAERQQILVEWNATEAAFPAGLGLHQLVEAQVEANPDQTALLFEGASLTYRQLNVGANQLARYLVRLGVGPDVLVCVYMERSLELHVALYAILKAGGAYVPLDPLYPKDRIRFMLADTAAPVVLTQHRFLGEFADVNARVLCIDKGLQPLVEDQSEENLGRAVSPEDLAYVIYTSGSTGQPKGVMAPHRAICNLVQWRARLFSLSASDRVLCKTPFSFDASLIELFWSLACGAQIVIARPEGHKDSRYLADLIADERVTMMDVVPSMLSALLDEPAIERCDSLRVVTTGADVVTPDLVQRFFAKMPADLYNLYGPTETAVEVTCWKCSADPALPFTPIGRPMANVEAYILDSSLHPVPVGVPGELHIGGIQLARGYLNRPDLTEQQFIFHPFRAESGARLYKTGDLARYLPDGNIVFLGRGDQQVKVRGFRIELGEIEVVLKAHPVVRDAIVIAMDDARGAKQLVGYVVVDAYDESWTDRVRAFLEQRLPEYMIPAFFVRLERIPLLPNGKLDRRSLPLPDLSRLPSGPGFVAPRTPIEEIVAGIWSELLGVERVGVGDNFFHLGGHSLLATQVMTRVRAAFNIEVPLRALFETPTVDHLAQCIRAAQEQTRSGRSLPLTPMDPEARARGIPLSFAQQRLWFLDQLMPGSSAYNIPGMLRVSGKLNFDAIRKAFTEIVRRHETLRTRFESVDGTPLQIIDPPGAFPVQVLDLSHLDAQARESEAQRLAAEETARPFDLRAGPVLRATVLRLDEEDHVLLLSIHHIAGDGWSVAVFMHELGVLYDAYCTGKPPALPGLPIQYADFAVWQRQWLQGEILDAQLAYWREKLADPQLLELPTDRPRSALQHFEGATQAFTISKAVTEQLRMLSRREGATLFMTMLAAFKVLLRRWTGQDDIIVGAPIANRSRVEVESLIGFLLNTLVMRTDLSGNPTFAQLVRRVRETALGAYAHQDLPFEKLVEALDPVRDLSRTPFFQVMFVFQNMPDAPLDLHDLKVTRAFVDQGDAKVDINLHLEEQGGGLAGALHYNTELFNADTIAQMLRHFDRLLTEAARDANQPIARLRVLSDEELHPPIPPAPLQRPRRAAPFPRIPRDVLEQSIGARFEEQVRKHGSRLAVKTRTEAWTYGELNAAANRVARAILDRCGPGEQRVGLLFKKGAPMLAAIMGVLKAGKTYVPLDLVYPRTRLALIASDAEVSAIISDRSDRSDGSDGSDGSDRLGGNTATIPYRETQTFGDSDLHGVVVSPDTTAYLLYTSGSTGQPKGVVQNHRNVLHYNRAYTNDLYIDVEDRLTLFSSFGFDAAVVDIFAALLNGATLYPIDLREESAVDVADWLTTERVTIYHSTPSAYRAVIGELPAGVILPSVEVVVLGGEQTRLDDLAIFRQRFSRDCTFVNLLGTTETTYTHRQFYGVDAVVRYISPSVGVPTEDTEMLLMDGMGESGQVFGEIAIRSPHVALGYWRCPELTEAAFSAPPPGESRRVYRTGDMGRLLPDGTLLFMGRRDLQVKIRGFRVELGEIEAVLKQHPAVREALVLACEDGAGGQRLVAYVVAPDKPEAAVLRAYLQERVPSHMIPGAFVGLDAFPLTPNGKIDRRALAVLEDGAAVYEKGNAPPETEEQRRLVALWEELIGVSRIGIDDNFFDVGGHSILAITLVHRIEQAFRKRVPLAILFQTPTVRQLAAALSASQPIDAGTPVVALCTQGARPPFFCMPGIRGEVYSLRAFSDLIGLDQPFYGLQIDDTEEPVASLEALAADFITHIRRIQPKGPYYLGGLCFGGVLAYEVAQQLTAAGEKVALLALFEAYAPLRIVPWLDRVHLGIQLASALTWRERFGLMKKTIRDYKKAAAETALMAILKSWLPDTTIMKYRQRKDRRRRSAITRKYIPKPYHGKISLFRASRTFRLFGYQSDTMNGWVRLCSHPIEAYTFDCGHADLMMPPQIAPVAEQLRRCLDNEQRAQI